MSGRSAVNGGSNAGGSTGTSPNTGGTGITISVGESGAAGADDTGSAGTAGAAGAPSLDPNEACALSTDTVEAIPSVLQLVIDTSGSMDWPPGWAPVTPDDSKPPGATKWEITRDALRNAVDSLSDDITLGATFFPDTTEDDPDSLCLRNEVALPLGVLGAAASKQRNAWSAALDPIVPHGATPTEGAYLFGLEQLDKTESPGNRFLLLITDGTPTCTLDCECTEDNLPVDSGPLIDDAATALAQGIRTFVIGSPGSEDTRPLLSALARKGGTAPSDCSDDGPVYCHLDMTTEPDLAKGLASALDQVAASLRSCQYPIPTPSNLRTLDPNLVNVLFTPSNGKTQTIGRDPSKAACNEGWQYSPDGSSILLCGDACEAAKQDVGAKVEILFGCRTVMVEPR
ncbi:MAG TPA: vWA domain-containing protein [Polyangiaceae bacterium]|nr:vWA domain-containing protein [Polyangiaceae bacterium]